MASTNKKVYFAISTAVVLCLISAGILISSLEQKQLSSETEVPVIKNPAFSTESQVLNSTSTPSVQKPTEKKIAISLKAGDDIYQISIPKNSSVYDAMADLSASSIKPLTFEAENYPSLGYFVKSINGVKNAGGKYWTLYVNEKYSTVGASDYRLLNGDEIEWKFK